ncbi:NAD(P)H-dependent oxidoreductase [Streptomyces antimycoticus]|uniref:Oxidoreductase n=1 Tax=Streptomyces antimycoticus TaxID=68175 RepID=A0A4D4KT54_9ACTN|nr:oxidoreductase [Streptomyces antimycoticus]
MARLISDTGATVDLAAMRDFDMPLYDGDMEAREGLPRGALALRDRLDRSDAFVISSPEYYASVPGVLKNAIDWVSRVRPQPFKTKHALLVSASPSLVGGNRGLWALRIPLEHLGTRVYPDMFSVANSYQAFTEDGTLADPGLRRRLTDTVAGFLSLVEADVR